MIVITGANGGIGQAETRALAKSGQKIIMACRNLEKAEQMRQQVVRETGNTEIEVMSLDLASFASVFRFAGEIRERGEKVEVLINNAGIMCRDFQQTGDGLEMMTQVNYAAPYLLTRLLLPMMEDGGRIINTTSCTYRMGKVDEDFFQLTGREYRLFPVYGSTKLAVLLFTVELAERMEARSIGVFAVDPGIVDTGIITMHRWFDPLADCFFRPFIKSPEKGAKAAVLLAGSDGKYASGTMWVDARERNMPVKVIRHPFRRKLWNMTEELLAGYLNDSR